MTALSNNNLVLLLPDVQGLDWPLDAARHA